MAGFANARDIELAYTAGQFYKSIYRKQTTAVHASGQWADLTRQPGSPSPFYYASAPLVFAQTAQSTHGGFLHGPSVLPMKKFIKRLAWTVASTVAASAYLLDIVGYIPFIPQDEPTVEETIDFSAGLPTRAGDGTDLKMYCEIAAPHTLVTGNTLIVTYTNSAGVAGRVTSAALMQTAVATNGVCLLANTTAFSLTQPGTGPFFSLQAGDSGIQSVQSIRIEGGGDVGLFTLVLCKVVALLPPHLGGASATEICWNEVDFIRSSPILPRVLDDAYLSVMLNLQTTALAQVIAEADFIWS
jgi:hypothetical protein